MKLDELDAYFRSVLDLDRFAAADPSCNGIQVENDGADISKAAFAVDACLETIERAAAAGAGLLFVHHGLFWREPLTVTGSHYRRIAALLRANIALYACHLPLDANEQAGNNYGIARRLGLRDLSPFGLWHGVNIGVQGWFETALPLETVIARLFPGGEKPATVLPFGPSLMRRAAVVSGGAGEETEQAVKAGADVYITGEISHEIYHCALENRITVIAGGHYQTETVGVSVLAEKLAAEKPVETCFIDVPTGL